MEKRLTFTLLGLFLISCSMAQTNPVRIIFDVTSNDTLTHQATMRHVSMMADAYKDSKFEVVIYGGSLPMVLKGKSTVSKSIIQLGSNKNVAFKVCKATMDRYKVNESNLLPGVEVVPDGILEIVNKQGEGWGYIKEAHN